LLNREHSSDTEDIEASQIDAKRRKSAPVDSRVSSFKDMKTLPEIFTFLATEVPSNHSYSQLEVSIRFYSPEDRQLLGAMGNQQRIHWPDLRSYAMQASVLRASSVDTDLTGAIEILFPMMNPYLSLVTLGECLGQYQEHPESRAMRSFLKGVGLTLRLPPKQPIYLPETIQHEILYHGGMVTQPKTLCSIGRYIPINLRKWVKVLEQNPK
jgi:hypothetical protein